jgi:hypothetical protein
LKNAVGCGNIFMLVKNADVAQLVEQRTCNAQVISSNLIVGSSLIKYLRLPDDFGRLFYNDKPKDPLMKY